MGIELLFLSLSVCFNSLLSVCIYHAHKIMSDYIPQELWPEIFRRSTPKTLIRCLCVCKSWRSFISSPSFKAAHLAAQRPHFLVRKAQQMDAEEEEYVVFRPQSSPSFDLCFRSQPLPNFNIIGTANGVVCLTNEGFGMTDTILLWNPLIRKCLSPPTPVRSASTLGFGFDPCTQDLKIVRVSHNISGGGGRHRSVPMAEVFSVRDWCWRAVDYDCVDCYTFHNRWSQCFLNGAGHWAAYLKRTRDVLLSFHFDKEEFKIIELPEDLPRAQAHVSKFGSMLSVLHYKHTYGVRGAEGCDIWAMREYGVASSWSKMMSVSWEGGGLRNVLWVREDGEQMLVSTESEQLLSYNPINQQAIQIDGIPCKGDGHFADDFVPSFVLFNVKDQN